MGFNMKPLQSMAMALILMMSMFGQSQGLKCLEGAAKDGNLTQFTSKTCESNEHWGFSLHTLDKNKPTLDVKMCWDETWENGVYNKFGCVKGQQCLDGTCYENATVCLCKYADNCNNFLDDGLNDTKSTPLPYPPSTPKGGHQCYYGVKENDTASLDSKEICRNQENLCVRIKQEEDYYEYRSCWDSDFSIEYSRPGCYKGFSHCHRGHCHNDTQICVCEPSLCNDETYSSQAPPITPGSGLYCYKHDYHGFDEQDYVECEKNEEFCIEITNGTGGGAVMYRGCWSTDYEEGRYNFTGCESGTHCVFGDCYNNTVCVCENNLCNDFQLKENATTASPVPMTTTNNTMHCMYGMQRNSNVTENWQVATCAPEETACMYIDGDHGFHLARCYDFNYNDGRYNKSGCYDEGQQCWDNECHNGTICICDDKPLCNNPEQPTSSPHPETPGSGLDCYYGNVWGNDQDQRNLTKQICNKNETMCIAAYGNSSHDGSAFAWFGCHDPTEQSGHFNQTDVCVEAPYCWEDDHDDHPHCVESNVCTCKDSLCNSYNASSTFSPGTEPPTQPNTMRCYFGERHPGTGPETWKVETCQDNENFCFQIVSGDGYESRECWDLNYEDEEYAGEGCYKGKHCHHEHCFEEVTACICSSPLCNDWTPAGNVSTEVPVTDGSGILCYVGEYPDYEARQCRRNETTCSYLQTSDREYVDCYDPSKNNGKYQSDSCAENVDIDDAHGHLAHGRFCVCDGKKDDLCNGDYLKNKPENAAAAIQISLLVIHLFVLFHIF